ncbi:MAG: choice-of-anchor B family protein [Planctomycetes bacterium]|nr:choice-of-anchor B family protein [Planctomycetota bacterium]
MQRIGFRTAVALTVWSSVCLGQLAHDDSQWQQDRQPPYLGPGYRMADGGAPPLNFSSNGVQLLAWIPLNEFGPTIVEGNSCFGFVSPSGREYAIIGTSGGTGFVEVTSPTDPVIVAHMTGPDSSWRDMKTYQGKAYSVSEAGSGIQVFDLSGIDSGVVTQINTVLAGGTLSTAATHTVALNTDSGYLYRCGGGGGTIGLRIYSLADPANPTFVAEWHNRYVHEAQVVTYTSGPYAGKELAYCYTNNVSNGGNANITVLDVTNKTAISTVGVIPYSTPSFSHQGWLSPDRQYLYHNDELDGLPRTRIFNVSDPAAAFEVGFFNIGSTAIDHNIYTVGNYIFEANYRNGLNVFDATNPTAPVRIGYFDTYVEDDSPNFNGLWNNYPYLPSGVVLGSDIEKGLFVWWIGNPLLAFSYPQGQPTLVDPAGETVQVQIDEDTPGVLLPGTTKVYYDTGSGFASADLTPLGGGLFEASLPAAACGTTVNYYFAATSNNNIIWRDPAMAPAEVHTAVAAVGQTLAQEFLMEAADGWSAGAAGDNATAGVWTRVDPVGTGAQPEDDHTPSGTMCWVTGQGFVGGSVGAADVDGGKTTLLSPILDLSAVSTPRISYWRWYSNSAGSGPHEDVFTVDISNDGGANWVNVETVGPGGPETDGGWFARGFLVADFLTPTAQVRLRFVASDVGNGSIVEAAVDDLQVNGMNCGAFAAPTVLAEGSRALVATPLPGVDPLALLLSSDDYPCLTKYVAADGSLGDTPTLQTPGAWGTVVIRGSEVVPGTNYKLQSEFAGGARSVPADATTAVWGDVDGNSVVNFTDIQQILLVFLGNPQVSLAAADLEPCDPNNVVNFSDVQRALKAFQGDSYATLGCAGPCAQQTRTDFWTLPQGRLGRTK